MTAPFDTTYETNRATIEKYLALWNLTPDGEPIPAFASLLLPVHHHNAPAMLKLAVEEEERFGTGLLIWWNGDGAVRMLEHDDNVFLMERAVGTRSLAHMARNNQDDEATRILCQAVAKLHAPRPQSLPELTPLKRWFRQLGPAPQTYGDFIPEARAIARDLLDHPQDLVVLHGDIHHGNILDAGERGWLAIDPKRLYGERGFDYANILRNPDLEIATSPGRFARQIDLIAENANLDRTRLLQWVLTLTALSTAWLKDDGMDAPLDRAVAMLALDELHSAKKIFRD